MGTPTYPLPSSCECPPTSCIVCIATYRNVPPLNSNSTPVANSVLVLLPSAAVEYPSKCAAPHVNNAPTGAAREKTMRCARAARVLRPCFKRTDVRPNAAGALWIMIAKKMMKLSRLVVVLDAPNAIPSAHAWMTRPTVVDDGREVERSLCCVDDGMLGVSGTEDERSRVRLNWVKLMLKRCGLGQVTIKGTARTSDAQATARSARLRTRVATEDKRAATVPCKPPPFP